jgi:hypothetical protein
MSTLVAQTLSNGSVSTSTANCIRGSSRAWVNFVTASGSINGSYNVSSVTRIGTGQYTVNFASPMANSNYVVTVGYSLRGIGNGANSAASYVGFDANTISLQQCLISQSSGTAYDQGNMCVAVFS